MKNVILIMTDEHHHNVMGCAGNKIAHTPNLDSLAKTGVHVTDCYCTYPLCVPSRLSFLSGEYCSNIKAWDNTSKLKQVNLSLAKKLRDQKTPAFLVGKMHLVKNEPLGFISLGPQHLNKRVNAEFSPKKRKLKPTAPFFLNGQGVKVNTNHKHDLVCVRKLEKFLQGTPQEPFFMTVGFISPHFPMAVPASRYLDRFMDTVKLPQPFEPGHDAARTILDKMVSGKITKEETKKALALYYGLTMWMDERVGETVNIIKSSKYSDNTDIIYTSDHGDMLGQHGLWMKGCLYEGAVRVPLIISDGVNTGKRQNVCSTLDLSTTIGRRFGLEDFGKGRDLQPLIEGTDWEDIAYAQHYGPRLPGSMYMVRSKDWKYIYTTGTNTKELYNLAQDPNELDNVAERNQGRCVALHKRMVDEFGGKLSALRG